MTTLSLQLNPHTGEIMKMNCADKLEAVVLSTYNISTTCLLAPSGILTWACRGDRARYGLHQLHVSQHPPESTSEVLLQPFPVGNRKHLEFTFLKRTLVTACFVYLNW